MSPLENPAAAASPYARLFGGPFCGHDEAHLRELSLRMKDVPQFNVALRLFREEVLRENFYRHLPLLNTK
jgi:hypothetical protein